MAELQTQKTKKAKKKPEMSNVSANTLTDKDVQSSITLCNDGVKQNLLTKIDPKPHVATDDCEKGAVDESAGKKKKKSKKKSSKEVLKETFPENNKSESLLNFSANGIHLLNHPEISVTITDGSESKEDEVKSEANKVEPVDEKKTDNEDKAAAASKKKKNKKKKKNSIDAPAVTTSNETSVPTPSYTKVVTSDNTCVLVVNNEFSMDAKTTEISESKKNKSESRINFSLPPEKQFGDVLLTKKFSPDTNIQLNNSVSIFPVITDDNLDTSKSQARISINHKSEEDTSASKPCVSEAAKENSDESKTKAELKAERRALQEAQRAAKLAKTNAKGDSASSANEGKKNPPKEKPLPKETVSNPTEASTEKTCAKAAVEKEALYKVKLFSHLPQWKKLDINAKIHPAILEVGFQYNKGFICGSNARCVALLGALKEVITDYTPELNKNFCRELESSVQSYLSYLGSCRPLSVSMINAIKFLKHEINHMPSDIGNEEIKERLCDFINNFVKIDILMAKEAISNCASNKIVDGDVILVFAFSSLIRHILCKAHSKKKIFKVIVVDSRPKLEGLKMLRYLVKQGLHCSYVSINAILHVIEEVSKVILGAHALLSNGCVMSRLGNKQIALVASTFDVPLFVCCESYKFCERVLSDSIVHNELGEPEDIIATSLVLNDSLKNWRDLPTLQPLNLLYDVTSIDLISEIITEKGAAPCSAVPILLRAKYNKLSQ